MKYLSQPDKVQIVYGQYPTDAEKKFAAELIDYMAQNVPDRRKRRAHNGQTDSPSQTDSRNKVKEFVTELLAVWNGGSRWLGRPLNKIGNAFKQNREGP